MKQERDIKSRRRQKQKVRNSIRILIYGFLFCGLCYGLFCGISTFGHWDLGRTPRDKVSGTGNAKMNDQNQTNDKSADVLNEKLNALIEEDSSLQIIMDHREDYPDQLVYLLVHNKETKKFVLNYPKVKDLKTDFTIQEKEKKQSFPHFLQWDSRWGYKNYGEEMISIDGCGPTCMSMVYCGLTKDYEKNPFWMSEFSEKNCYYTDGATKWDFMTDGAQKLGLKVKELPMSEERIIQNLEVGNPIICIMGPGAFTSKGHFIVLTGVENGKIIVHDPNSIERTEKLWDFEEFSSQVRNLWVYWK